jgi:hypothetical protein
MGMGMGIGIGIGMTSTADEYNVFISAYSKNLPQDGRRTLTGCRVFGYDEFKLT